MLTQPKQKEFQELVKGATHAELVWMSGFLQGVLSQSPHAHHSSSVARPLAVSLCSLLYGTETGNSKKLASDFASKLKKQGVAVKLSSMDHYRLSDLEKEVNLLLIMSTHGDGEPPEAAKKFYNYIHTQNLSLNKLHYAVVALGDTAYPLFCKAGEDVDKRFAQLNAQRMAELKKCDVDFEQEAHQWLDELIEKFFFKHGASLASPISTPKIQPTSGRKIWEAKVLTSINLNDDQSNKETYHIELETLEPIDYEPGDALGIVPMNRAASVQKVLQLMGLNGSETFEYKESKAETALNLFTKRINLRHLPERIVKHYAALVNKDIPALRMDLAELLSLYPAEKRDTATAQQMITLLDPITPRLYSISSSPALHGKMEVHITVSKHNFLLNSQKLFGFCSQYLSDLRVGDQLKVYVQKNNAFKLPAPETDLIMIGPGTGIAPFRAFLFERDARGASGRNWLFFGEQHFVSDFLYQTELQSLYDTGVLTKLNTAFSRDQKEKVYVQHKLKQHADELVEWLDRGAHLYICGSKEPMSLDVENALIQIFSQKKKINLTDAEAELHALRGSGRYHKDVY
jgi:sulfite reductase (NADPH) flavoprotein alpha-component